MGGRSRTKRRRAQRRRNQQGKIENHQPGRPTSSEPSSAWKVYSDRIVPLAVSLRSWIQPVRDIVSISGIVAIVSIFLSILAFLQSREANSIAKEANSISEKEFAAQIEVQPGWLVMADDGDIYDQISINNYGAPVTQIQSGIVDTMLVCAEPLEHKEDHIAGGTIDEGGDCRVVRVDFPWERKQERGENGTGEIVLWVGYRASTDSIQDPDYRQSREYREALTSCLEIERDGMFFSCTPYITYVNVSYLNVDGERLSKTVTLLDQAQPDQPVSIETWAWVGDLPLAGAYPNLNASDMIEAWQLAGAVDYEPPGS